MQRIKYISMIRGYYMVKVGTKYIGTRKTIDEAVKLRNEYCQANNIQLPEDKNNVCNKRTKGAI